MVYIIVSIFFIFTYFNFIIFKMILTCCNIIKDKFDLAGIFKYYRYVSYFRIIIQVAVLAIKVNIFLIKQGSAFLFIDDQCLII